MKTALVTALVLALLPAPAAAERIVTVPTPPAAGPARYDRVRVLEQGPARARNVLVLVPGTSGGGTDFELVGEALVRRLRGWQVWSVDRRENALEDHSVLDAVLRRRRPLSALFPYYLGRIGTPPAAGPRFVPRSDASTGYGRRWGLATAVGDLHAVLRAARRGGRRVVLGGHSLGASIVTAYATWSFRGRAGARDLAGLVFVDGGTGPTPRYTAAGARAALAELSRSSPWLDLTGLGLPWSAGVFNAVGSTLALRAPHAPSVFQGWPLLPPHLQPAVPVTNSGQYGWVVDTGTGPRSLALVQMHIGRLERAGTPRRWVDGELGTVARAASVFSGVPTMDGSAWYHPRRLSLEAGAVANGTANPAQRVLGVHATRGRDARLPVYAIETALGRGRVIAAARALADRARVPRRWRTFVDRSRAYAHFDPLVAAPRRNDFLRTVVPFLRRLR